MAKRGKSPRAQVPLRIPEALRARLEKAAKAGNKSMNAEILERLEQSFQFDIRIGGPGGPEGEVFQSWALAFGLEEHRFALEGASGVDEEGRGHVFEHGIDALEEGVGVLFGLGQTDPQDREVGF